MGIKYITCSGANEHTDIDSMISLGRDFSLVEYGVQVSGRKCSFSSDRWAWLKELHQKEIEQNVRLNVSLHLNQDWVEKFCAGKYVPELETLLSWRIGRKKFIHRVQLNFKIGREPQPDMECLENMVNSFPDFRFILSYNDNNADFIDEIYRRKKIKFDCLYDDSFGEGILAKERKSPAFSDVLQGYAGGLSPENIGEELTKISKKLPCQNDFFIDAEGRLKGEKGFLSIERCKEFVVNALVWENINLIENGD